MKRNMDLYFFKQIQIIKKVKEELWFGFVFLFYTGMENAGTHL